MQSRFAVFAFASVLAFGQTPPDPSAQPAIVSEKPAGIEGTVQNATTGEPLPHVHVVLRGAADRTQRQYGAMTSPDGKFSVTSVVPGSYSVSADRVGFVMTPGPSSRTQIRLQAEQKKSDMTIKMLPTGQITGTVTDADGQPMEFVSVNAQGVGSGYGSTDEKGQYRIGGLAPGRYRVRAQSAMGTQAPQETRSDGTEDVHYAGTYYPGVIAAKEASRVEVRSAGDSSGVNIQLKRVPWVKVTGKVLGKVRASDQASVIIQSSAPYAGNQAFPIKPDGTFVLWRLEPGKYRISAGENAPGGEYIRSAPVEIEVAGSDIENIVLRVVPNFELAGQLQYENDQAREMPAVPQRPGQAQDNSPPRNAPKPRRTLILRDAYTGNGQVSTASVSEDDTFTFKRVQPGRYRVTLTWDSAYVKSAQLGPDTVDKGVIDLSGGSAGTLALRLAAATGSISGTVRDDSGTVQGTRVALVSDEPDSPPFTTRYSIAKADGSYSFPNLPPGDYKIVAVSEADTDLAMQSSGLDEYEEFMDKIHVQADEKISKDLRRRNPNAR
jgi:hypothetical protein